MIIEEIQLEQWKLFRERISIKFSEGFNILFGPNESGKTTLIDSINVTFFSKHTSTSEKIKSLIPWGSALAPSSSIIFRQNGDLYRIRKTLISPRSELARLVKKEWKIIAEGDKADQKVTELVRGQLPKKGDTKPDFWGYGQALWMVQGQPFISERLNEETVSALKEIIGATLETQNEKIVFEKIGKRFHDVFTEKQRKYKEGTRISQVLADLERLKAEKEEAEKVLKKKTELLQEIESSGESIRKLEGELKAVREKKEILEKRLSEARKHQENRMELEKEVEKLRTEVKTLKERIDKINNGRDRIDSLESQKAISTAKKDQDAKNLKKLEEKIQSINKRIFDIEKEIDQRDKEGHCARIAHSAVLEELELIAKEESLKKVQKTKEKLENTQKSLKDLKSPSKEDLKQIEKLFSGIRETKTKLEAIGLKIEAVAEADISGSIFLDGLENRLDLRRAQRGDWSSWQSVKIHIENVGRFEIYSGSEDVSRMKETLEELEKKFNEAVVPYGTGDLDSLRARLTEKEGLEREVKRLQDQVKELAPEGEEILNREIQEKRGRINSNWEKIKECPKFFEYSQTEDKEAARKELSKIINDLEAEINMLKGEKDIVKKELEDLQKRKEATVKNIKDYDLEISEKSGTINEIQKQLVDLQNDSLTLEEREKKLSEIAQNLDQKERALRKYNEEKEEKEEKPLKSFDECNKEIERLNEAIQDKQKSIAEAQGELKSLSANQKDFCEIEENLEFLEKERQSLETEAKAIELLYSLTQLFREKAREKLRNPLTETVEKDLGTILGSKYSIKLNEGLKPEKIGETSWGIKTSMDSLSFGTQEQIWCLFRLALGRFLSKMGPQLVVLDDPLANTDPDRLLRFLEVLKEASEHFQIILITCDVEKYFPLKSWKKARFIDLAREMKVSQ